MVRRCYSAVHFQLPARGEYGAKFFTVAETRHFFVGTPAYRVVSAVQAYGSQGHDSRG